MQTQDMSKDLSFRLRLDAVERERLDTVAAHYAVSASTAVRLLIKEKYDQIQTAKSDEDLRDEHGIVLDILTSWHKETDGEPTPRADLDDANFAQAIDAHMPSYPTANFRGGISRVLNELVRWGYLRRIKAMHGGSSIVVLPKALSR